MSKHEFAEAAEVIARCECRLQGMLNGVVDHYADGMCDYRDEDDNRIRLNKAELEGAVNLINSCLTLIEVLAEQKIIPLGYDFMEPEISHMHAVINNIRSRNAAAAKSKRINQGTRTLRSNQKVKLTLVPPIDEAPPIP